MVYSFSSLTMYETCPYSYYLRKIEKTEGERNGYAEIGTYAHGLLEKIEKKEITIDEALGDCAEFFFDNVTDPGIKTNVLENKYQALCDYFSSLPEDYLKGYEIVNTEKMMWWTFANRRMCGVIDLVLKDVETGELILVDHKSSPHFLKKDGTPLKSQKENFEKYKKQMYLYAYAMKQFYKKYPSKIVWNHFLDGGALTVIPFDEKEMWDTMRWVADIIVKIEEDKEFSPCCDNYMMCNVLCDYRNGICEYKGLEDYAELS